MSRRGEIVVECDTHCCHAEQAVDSDALADTRPMDSILADDGWRIEGGKDICPQCVEESKAPERDEAYERAAARARDNDFADTNGNDWT